jgi:hypothetical protein
MASIDQTGLLLATGSSIGNGTVLVKAMAMDGSGVADSIQITITNQGADFEILLVNDNANGINRYKELDTTLTNLGYTYDIYNTIITNDFPDANTLSYYEMVIWYTGNDGVNLYLWDVSDTNNYKFNQPLIEYLDNGGLVWLQGLDFFYDIYGAAPDNFTDGQFIYDYMGVASYFAQSYDDDGEMGVPQLDAVPGNSISTFTPIQWVYSTMWHVDALEMAPSAQGIYTLGPDGYVFDEYFAGVYNENGNSRILTFTFETARIDTEEHTDELFQEVIEYFVLWTGVSENQHFYNMPEVEVFPNPATSMVTFSNTLDEQARVKLSILDFTGKSIFNRDYGVQQSGNFDIVFPVKEHKLRAGIYFYSLNINDQPFTGKIIITK